jgi:hypothetical protein
MPPNIDPIDTHADQVNIWAVLSYVLGRWRWYVNGAVIGLIAGGLYFWLAPPKYEASVVIQPARVGSILKGSVSRVQSDEPEPAPLMIERVRQPGFYTEVIREQCAVAASTDFQKNMVDNINVNVVKLPNPTPQSLTMAKITWKGSTASAAGKCIEAIVEALTQAQNQIITPTLATLAEQKAQSQKLLDIYVAEMATAKNRPTVNSGGASFSQIIIADNAAQNLRESLSLLKVELAEVTAQLAPPYSQPVTKLEPIYVSPTPIIPLGLALVIGGLIGILGGVVALLIMRSIRLYKVKSNLIA